MKKVFVLIMIFSYVHTIQAQVRHVKALFLGNSYTAANNLPELISQLALSSGDILEYDSNTPGGYTFQAHSTNSNSLNLIEKTNWDFVVLQEQSQLPSFPEPQVEILVYPYAALLDSIIKANNICASSLFYMTWGRENGDAQHCPEHPVVCTYEGMDSLLQLRYSIMAERNNAALSPVAKVWRRIRNEYPDIDLYSGDGSHPSINGSFAAACSFYSMMFEKDPVATAFNASIKPETALLIKEIAKEVVYDSLDFWHRHVPNKLKADFTYSVTENTVDFFNHSQFANSFHWDFGDTHSGTESSPKHTYNQSGMYHVQLTAKKSNCSATQFKQDSVYIDEFTFLPDMETETLVELYPNPVTNQLHIQTTIELAEFQLIDVFGRSKKINPNRISMSIYRIETDELEPGTYFIHTRSTKGQAYVLKFIKSRFDRTDE